MGAGGSSCCILAYDHSWQSEVVLDTVGTHALRVIVEDGVATLPVDACILVLEQLDVAALQALTCTCRAMNAVARDVLACFNERWSEICARQNWSVDSLAEVGIHVLAQGRHFTPCPPWLSRLSERLLRPHYHHMQYGVVAKAFDAMGPLNAQRTAFARRFSHRRLFFAHIKHNALQHGGALITQADVDQLRKLRGLQAYMYAEGWASNGRASSGTEPAFLYEHALEHAMEGRIELS